MDMRRERVMGKPGSDISLLSSKSTNWTIRLNVLIGLMNHYQQYICFHIISTNWTIRLNVLIGLMNHYQQYIIFSHHKHCGGIWNLIQIYLEQKLEIRVLVYHPS